MIDIHTHILPGMDDGAQDLYDTLEMVRLAADSGVTAMVATPHCNIPGIFENYFNELELQNTNVTFTVTTSGSTHFAYKVTSFVTK